jgi:hypothetical protein
MAGSIGKEYRKDKSYWLKDFFLTASPDRGAVFLLAWKKTGNTGCLGKIG